LQLQVSAQIGSQKISEQNEVATISKMGGKTGKNNKLGAFAKMLDGLRVVSPRNSAAGANVEEAAGGVVKQRVQQLVARKNQPKTAQAREILSIAGQTLTEQTPVESKKKNSSQQQEARGIEALFVNKIQDSAGKTRKTAVSPSGAEQGKKELSVNAPGVALPKAADLANIQETALPASGGASSLKSVASTAGNAAETALKSSGRKKEAAPSAGEIPPSVVEQPLLTKEAAAQRQAQTDGEGRVAKAKRKDRFDVEIHDARTVNSSANSSTAQPLQASAVRTDVDAAEITLDLTHAQDAPETEAPDKAMASRNFADMLSRALGDTLSNDIARQASIVLRDGGQGTIRLSLKPETLGSVKIRLELVENKITGTIFVSSEEAYRAFEKEVHTLEQAFKESGFESADLNTTFASGDGRSGRQWDEAETSRYFSERFVAERYDAIEAEETVHALGSGWEPEQRIAVNMFV
jgi:flagellar hook-length control protein FliK